MAQQNLFSMLKNWDEFSPNRVRLRLRSVGSFEWRVGWSSRGLDLPYTPIDPLGHRRGVRCVRACVRSDVK